MDIDRWRAIYGDLHGARINATAQDMLSLYGVNQNLDLYARDANVELPILHLDYHRFRPDALSSGRLRNVRNRLYDVAGQNPYEARTAFAVAASATQLGKASTAFIFRSNLFFTNTGRTVATLQADFADGNGFVGMSWNTARPVSYSTAGPKDVRVRVSYTDGSTWESHLLVMAPAPAPQARYSGGASEPPTTILAEKVYNGQTATATVSVEYSGQNKQNPDPKIFDKPLIVVKGFDVSGIIGGEDARSTYRKFIAIELNQTPGVALSDGADLDGYDLVYVDFDNGTDYIQRNAFLLETVIKWVNGRKAAAGSTQPNVMLAMSMGGLVAQYALCDIEAAGSTANNSAFPHQVRLLITHDSPHQGANVPLSLQMALRHLAGTTLRLPLGVDIRLVDYKPELGKARDALLSPAAQQMLRYQTTRLILQAPFGAFAGPVIAAPTSLYDTFQQAYQALLSSRGGAPSGTAGRPCRVVASSNGSECGKGQPFGPYAELAHLDSNTELFDFPVFGAILINALTGVPTSLLGGTYYLRANASLRALPDQVQAEICRLDVRLDKTGGLFDFHIQLIDYRGSSRASFLPIDSGSGGIIPVAAFLQAPSSTLPPIIAGALRQTQFCFVPTYSALNITPGGSAALRATYTPGTSVGSPFANFRTAARENEPHISYTALNSTWMLRELRETPQMLSCAAFCAAMPTITGSPTICSGSNTTYSVNPPAGTTILWSIQPANLTTVFGPLNTNTLVLAPNTTITRGFVTLSATFQSDCGAFTVSRANVPVGPPAMPATQGPNWGLCATAYTTGRVDNYDAQASYLLSVTGNFQLLGNTVDSDGNYMMRSSVAGGTGTFTLRATNGCGATTSTLNLTAPACIGGRAVASTAALYPNPATTSVDVQTTDATPTAPITVRVFDAYGTPRAEQISTGATQVRLTTDQLPAGLYFVHLLRGAKVLSRQQLRIEK